MSVAIVKYNAGNVQSVIHACRRLGVEPDVTDDESRLRAAGHVIFPGVGEASSAMRYLSEKGLDRVLPELSQPVLGICLGLQLLCSHSEENDTPCLGVFRERVRRFPEGAKVPHIGWNRVADGSGPLFAGLGDAPFFYFLHSYYAEQGESTCATSDYIQPFAAAVSRENVHAVQFHPEKSGPTGQKLLKNFLKLA